MEVELKLALDPKDIPRLRKARALRGVRPRRTRMDAIYLDTADRELARNGMALRLRREGDTWVQCLKAGRSGTGGLHSRHEWEYRQPLAQVDLARFAATPLARLRSADTLHRRLVPAFRVAFERTAWRVSRRRGSRLELALDVGEVSSGSMREPVCEVEIECLEGDPRNVFDLAHALRHSAALRPSAVTKARRGYRLFARERMQAVHALAPRIDAGMHVAGAARAVVGAGLDQLQANEEGLLAGDDPEFVHQARVALRRIRAALRMFRGVIGKRRARAWREELRDATASLGVARDWDVFAGETLPEMAAAAGSSAAIRAIARAARARQLKARAAARDAIASRAYASAVLNLSRWLALGDEAGPATSESVPAFARRVLRKRHRRLMRGVERLATMDARSRHQVRIDAKRLRYAVEGLAGVLDPRSARRYAGRLADLQDALGRCNDAMTGVRLLESLDPPARFVAFGRKWLEARMGAEESRLAEVSRRLARAKLPWRI